MQGTVRKAMRVKPLNVTVFEFDLLSTSNKADNDQCVRRISEDAYDYLENCCLSDETESRFLKMKIVRGMKVLQLQNYAGVVLCPDGTQIEVLPKVAKVDDGDNAQEQARLSLLNMLKSLKQLRHIQTEMANIKRQKMPLLEVFISQFLNSVNHLIKKGIKSDYVRQQDNGAYLKGKLLHSQQLKHNFINKHKFHVEYDEYLRDRPANRVIHSALHLVAGYTKVNRSKKLAQELLFAFDEVPLSKSYKNDFSAIKLDRGMQHYDAPISWSRLILEGFSPQSMLGNNKAFSLLFPMDAVFESFVAKYLKKQLPPQLKLSTQVQSKSLVTYDTKRYFRLKPDLVITDSSKADVDSQIVLDTKWKLIDQTKFKGKDKFGMSQADFYQMLGYGHKYLKGNGNLVLIYPKHSNFDKSFEHSFNYDEYSKLRLWVIPFDINHSTEERVCLPSDISINKLIAYGNT
ncbi:McrC family protein [Shewanella halifaxensis]|uniref:McrC family protein n=1 Tax=Shewanella halifaxensis TaxID=271098 RepID=UPI001F1D4ED5|nr:McrC family protein [Shewanella halifaxensis]